jgi:hypothetical protein
MFHQIKFLSQKVSKFSSKFDLVMSKITFFFNKFLSNFRIANVFCLSLFKSPVKIVVFFFENGLKSKKC